METSAIYSFELSISEEDTLNPRALAIQSVNSLRDYQAEENFEHFWTICSGHHGANIDAELVQLNER